jgi:spermidine synthase
MKRTFFVCLLSGFLHLSFEILASKWLALHVGSDNLSGALVAASFLLGIGLGCFFFSKYGKTSWYKGTLLFLPLTILAFLFPAPQILESLFAYFVGPESLAQGQLLLLVVVALLFLTPPATLMGAFFPLYLEEASKRYGIRPYLYYVVGNFVAVLSMVTLFFPFFALKWQFFFLAALSIGLAFAPVIKVKKQILNEPLQFAHLHVGLMSFFLLALECCAFRMIAVINPDSPYNFTFVLGTVLLGCSLSSWYYRKTSYPHAFHVPRNAFLAGLSLLMGLSLYSAFIPALLPSFPHEVKWGPVLLFCGLVLLGPSFFLSTNIPFFLRTQKLSPAKLTLTSSLGAFVGGVFIQLWGFELLGQRLILLVLLFSLFLYACWLANRVGKGRLFALCSAPLALVTPFLALETICFGVTSEHEYEVWEGARGQASVRWKQGHGELVYNGAVMSYLPRDPDHILLETLALMSTQKERILVIGLGSGQILPKLVEQKEVKRVDVVEWSQEVLDLLKYNKRFDLGRQGLNSQKVRVYQGDVRTLLKVLPANSYDLVIENLNSNHWFGLTQLKSLSYYSEVANVLSEKGVYFSQINYLGEENKLALFAGVRRSFKTMKHMTFSTHSSPYVPYVMATRGEQIFSKKLVREWWTKRWQEIGLPSGEVSSFYASVKKINNATIEQTDPITEGHVGAEFQYWKKLY